MKYIILLFAAALPLLAEAPAGSPDGCVNSTTGVIESHPCIATYTTTGARADSTEAGWFQAGLNSWHFGDTIKLESGKIWPTVNGFTTYRPGGTYSGVHATLTGTRDSELPEHGTRITLNYLCASTLNGCQTLTDTDFASSVLPILTGTLNQPALILKHDNTLPYEPAYGITVRGLGFYQINQTFFSASTFSTGLLLIGDAGSFDITTNTPEISDAATQQPGNITVQHCVFSGAGLNYVRVLINLNGSNVTIRDNFMERAQTNAQDSQGINGLAGLGPYEIENNYISAGSENIMFGGARTSYPDLLLSDVTIRYNLLTKREHQLRHTRWSAGQYVERGKMVWPTTMTAYTNAPGGRIALNSGTTGDTEPTWCSTTLCQDAIDGTVRWQRTAVQQWSLKNLFENKNGTNFLVQYNVTENLWYNPGGQETIFNLKIENKGLTESTNCPEYQQSVVNTSGTTVTRVSGSFPDIIHPGATSRIEVGSIDLATDTITVVGAIPTGAWATGRWVMIRTTGTLPGGLNTNTLYYMRNVNKTTETFQLSTTNSDSDIVNITSAGSGTHTLVCAGQDGLLVRINGAWYIVASYTTGGEQLILAEDAGTQTGVTMTIGDPTMQCTGASNHNMIVRDNWIRNGPQAIKLTCGVNGRASKCRDLTVTNNLATNISKTTFADFRGTGAPGATGLHSVIMAMPGLRVNHNTYIGNNLYALNYEIGLAAMDLRYTDSVWSNNLFAQHASNAFRVNGNGTEGAGLNNALCGGSPCTSATWNKNIFVGLTSTTTYPTGTTFNPSASAAGFVQYSALTGGNYRLAPTSPYRGAGTDGTDIGANMDEIPQIIDLQTIASDDTVLFRYRLSPVIANAPCVVELSTTRDMLTPVSYLQTFDGRNSDFYPEYPRDGGMRAILVSGLTPETKHWARLQCYGDARADLEITTKASVEGTRERKITFYPTTTGEHTLTWGTSYSGGAISGGAAPSMSCTANQACTISFTANRNTHYFYQIDGGEVRSLFEP